MNRRGGDTPPTEPRPNRQPGPQSSRDLSRDPPPVYGPAPPSSPPPPPPPPVALEATSSTSSLYTATAASSVGAAPTPLSSFGQLPTLAQRSTQLPPSSDAPDLPSVPRPELRSTETSSSTSSGASASTGGSGASGASAGSEERRFSPVDDVSASFFDRLVNMARSYHSIRDDMTSQEERPPLDGDDAILITVNYVFDQPNRLGLLVMLLPNILSSREPRAIQEFIRLATQMAYLNIINQMHHREGITVEKFNSFPTLTSLDEDLKRCYICFDDMEVGQAKREGQALEERPLKKRRLYDNLSEATSNESVALVETQPESEAPLESERPKLLCHHTYEYKHLAVQLPCLHVFGQSCLCEWLKEHSTCPLCREKLEEPIASEHHTSGVTYLQLPALYGRSPTPTPENSEGRDPPQDHPWTLILRRNELATTNAESEPPSDNLSPPPPPPRSRWRLFLPFTAGRSAGGSQVIFPMVVALRRTANGVETTEGLDEETLSSSQRVLRAMDLLRRPRSQPPQLPSEDAEETREGNEL